MSNKGKEPFDLDAFFAAAKSDTVEPSADFMERILNDAVETQNNLVTSKVPSPKTTTIWAALGAAIGGWPTVAGLATATVAGVWIGVSPPAELELFTDNVLGNSFEYSDYLPDIDSELTEG